MWTLVRRGVPQYLSSRIQIDADLKLSTDPARIQNTLSSYRWRASSLWNELDDDIRMNQSLQSFKKRLKLWIIDKRTIPVLAPNIGTDPDPDIDLNPDPGPDPDPALGHDPDLILTTAPGLDTLR